MRASEFIAEAKFKSDHGLADSNYLKRKQQQAISAGRDPWGVPHMGSTTGWFDSPVPVSVDVLKVLPGMRGEQQNVRKDDLRWLINYMKRTGHLPLTGKPGNQKEYPPYIMVAYNGEAWVNEGNHRIMAAAALGWDSLPVEIRYFDGGDTVRDGPLYPGKLNLNEGWREKTAAAMAAAALGYGVWDQYNLPKNLPPQTQQVQDQDQTIADSVPAQHQVLVQRARRAGIQGQELAHFIAQISHETNNWRYMEEQPPMGSRNPQRYFARKYENKRILGNIRRGDGYRFRGRGYVQLTGRDNYTRAGRALGLDLVNHPELASDPAVAADIAVWYWKKRVAPKIPDFSRATVPDVTRTINPAQRGIQQRQARFQKLALNSPVSGK